MENFNRVLSFVLGLVIVVILLAVISSRLRKQNRDILSFGQANETQEEPTKSPLLTPSTNRIVPTEPLEKSEKKGGLGSLFAKKPTTTPTKTPTKTPVRIVTTTIQKNTTEQIKGATTPTSIPKTGSPTHLLAFFASTLTAGIYLRKRK